MTIQLLFSSKHKSITSLDGEIELPDFTVLTGTNGSGKTHLFEAIAGGKVMVNGIAQNDVRRFDWTSLNVTSESANPAEFEQLHATQWAQICGYRDGVEDGYEKALDKLGISGTKFPLAELAGIEDQASFGSKFGVDAKDTDKLFTVTRNVFRTRETCLKIRCARARRRTLH